MQRDRGRGAAFVRIVAAMSFVISTAVALAPARAYADSGGEEQHFVARINAFRREHGLAPLTVDTHLTAVARNWSAHNAAAQQSSHNPNLASDVGPSGKLGENVGNGDSVDWLESSFEQSPEHEQNLLDPDFRRVGVGVVDTPDVVWVTQDFEADDDGGQSAAEPPSQPAQPPPVVEPAPAPDPPAGWVRDDRPGLNASDGQRAATPTASTARQPNVVAPAAVATPSPGEGSATAIDTLRNALSTWTALTG